MRNVDSKWASEIPTNWKVGRISYKYHVQLGKMLQPEPKAEDDVRKPYLRSANLDWNGVKLEDVKEMWMSSEDLKKYKLEPNDVLVSEGGDVGRSSFWEDPEEMYIQNAINRLRTVDESSNPKFLFYWFAFLKSHGLIDIMCDSSTIAHFTAEKVKATPLVFPSHQEQTQIAHFLDQKTSQINALIAQKEKLLKLLTEKRTAMITQAVTKGLDPNVKMKDSGNGLLGEIPANWKIVRLKFHGKTRYGLGEPPPKKEDGLPFIRATDIYRGKIDLENIQYIDPEFIPWSKNPTLNEGEILVVRSGAYTGDSARVTKECEGFIAGYDMVFTPITIDSRFLSFVLLSEYMLIGQIYQARNRAAQPHLNAEELGNFTVVLPSLNEQKSIAKYLEEFSESQEKVSSNIEQSISQLKEYREALITAAVTGQIDVSSRTSDTPLRTSDTPLRASDTQNQETR